MYDCKSWRPCIVLLSGSTLASICLRYIGDSYTSAWCPMSCTKSQSVLFSTFQFDPFFLFFFPPGVFELVRKTVLTRSAAIHRNKNHSQRRWPRSKTLASKARKKERKNERSRVCSELGPQSKHWVTMMMMITILNETSTHWAVAGTPAFKVLRQLFCCTRDFLQGEALLKGIGT